MDHLDLAVYRFLSPGGIARFWAGRRVVDPRITPREVAEEVGISESAVRARLRHLADRGFLKDRCVTPNPALFGRRVFVADLLVMHSGEVDRMLHDLALVEGVVFARDVLDEDERKLQVYFASETDVGAARVAALLGRLSSEGTALLSRPYYLPPCERDLSSLDWRVLQEVLRHPEATFAEVAKTVGISLKTAARGYNFLLDHHACWWTHGPTSEEFPLALVRVELEDRVHRDPVLAWVGQQAIDWMPVAGDGFGLDPGNAAALVVGLAPADLPTVLERFLRKLSAVEGVARVRRTFGLGSTSYPAWFADRVTERLHART